MNRHDLKDKWITRYKPKQADYSELFDSTFIKSDDIAELQSIAASSDLIVTTDSANIVNGYLKLESDIAGNPIINSTFIPNKFSNNFYFDTVSVSGVLYTTSISGSYLNFSTIYASNISVGELDINDYSFKVANTKFVNDVITVSLNNYSVSATVDCGVF